MQIKHYKIRTIVRTDKDLIMLLNMGEGDIVGINEIKAPSIFYEQICDDEEMEECESETHGSTFQNLVSVIFNIQKPGQIVTEARLSIGELKQLFALDEHTNIHSISFQDLEKGLIRIEINSLLLEVPEISLTQLSFEED